MASTIKCLVVTPEQTALDQDAEFVALPLYDGELGVAPGHSPMIGRLGYGQLRIRTASGTTSMYLDGGFVQVNNNVVSILTSRAVPATSLDKQAIEKQIEAASKLPILTDEQLDVRERRLAQARAQLRVARAR
ncbi:ATP synthase F1, epsilon subunit [Pirellula staleyi DSM 6068]|uniref:ATP synthase epsilon chain n=1 Tax=Pirellula staleyi (strain ATCC 27377 / DSM 6068 / ICPB 4128) TaxID=530564 RepID=D2R5X5_PIRSD|nr:ATP synthase F1 subunit epsilon [Pirellula staleyi]ADB19060.1 ATP synthase F1, epsilon subunit [Pirellula staleyi DSM 6068]